MTQLEEQSRRCQGIQELSRELRRRDAESTPRRESKRWRVRTRLYHVAKRALDLLVSLVALIVLMPLLLLIAVIIKLESPGPIIYRSIRVGRYGRHFCFFKFRSMVEGADQRKDELAVQNESPDGVLFKMENDARRTRFGIFLRKLSLDELPQLANVLLGDMSLVGPRPHLPSEVVKYSLEQRKSLDVLPGITGLAQITCRKGSLAEQSAMDQKYIATQSFWGDIMILLKTIPAVLSCRGAC